MSEVTQNNDYIELVERLSEIQSKIALGKELKGYGYSYRNAEQILQAVKPLLNGAIILCNDDLRDFEKIKDDKGGFSYHGCIVATVTMHYKTAFLSVKGYAFLDNHKGMSREQIVGCASSYARKYALQGLLAISDGSQDPDGLQPENRKPIHTDTQTAINNGLTETKDDKASRVYAKALSNLKGCNTVSEMLIKKAEMTAKMPEYKAEIAKAYDTAVEEMNALDEENQQAAQSHNDDCPF